MDKENLEYLIKESNNLHLRGLNEKQSRAVSTIIHNAYNIGFKDGKKEQCK